MGRLVIFEGVSGSGKTTLFTPVHQARKYKDLHIHRFTATHWVYAVLYDRPVNSSSLQEIELVLQRMLPTLVVWCRPDPETAKARTVAKGDTNVLDKDFFLADDYFARYLGGQSHLPGGPRYEGRGAYVNVLELDTGHLSVDECTRRVVEVLDGIG